MDDRFRFRAWDKEDKVMRYDAEETYDYMRSGIMAESFGELIRNVRYHLMQCTGIEDENEKLIHEGDILVDEYGGLFEVFWDHDGWLICGDILSGDGLWCYADRMQIVGNKFENQEMVDYINARLNLEPYDDRWKKLYKKSGD